MFKRVLTVQRNGEDVETSPPSETLYRTRMTHYVDELRRRSRIVEPVSRDKFLSRYSGRKLESYRRAKVNLERIESEGSLDYHELSKLKNFVKVEKLLDTKLSKAPRNISPRTYEFNILLGCYIAHLEKVLFRVLAKVCGFPVVFKGMNALQSG